MNADPEILFEKNVAENIEALGKNVDAQALSRVWSRETNRNNYTYNYRWMGRPIIQYPQDILAMQELIFEVKPDLIIETGVAHGGSLIFSASMLALLDMAEAAEKGEASCSLSSKRKVLGIDIDIRKHNRMAIEDHPMADRIQMIEGSSIDNDVIAQVKSVSEGYTRVLVSLDSNHTHEHVLAELCAYAPLVNVGGYCVVFDTLIDDMPSEMFKNRPWGPGDNPKTAVHEYLKKNPEFVIDYEIQHKLLITVAPDGYLKRIV